MSTLESNDYTADDPHVNFATSVNYLDSILDALSVYREEGKFLFTKDRIYSKIVDPATVAMCAAAIEGQALNSLNLNGAEQMKAAVNFEDLQDCLGGASSTSEVEVTWPVSSGSTKFVSLDIIDEDMTFRIPALNEDAVKDMPNKDPIEHSTRIVISGKDLRKAMSNAGIIIEEGDPIVLETFDSIFQVRASDKVDGEFSKQFYQNVSSDDEGIGEHQVSVNFKYLKDIKVLSDAENITVHIKEDHPVRFDLNLDESEDAKIIYLIAPRVSGD